MDWVTIATSASTALATTFISKNDEGPIKTLNDTWDLAFGNFHHFVDKKRAERAYNLEQYKIKIAENVNNIPEENRIEPTLSIIGPALDASKYYIEEEELRNMFAALISSSMDKTLSTFSHPSFVEIIKQLSPLDAQNIKLFMGQNKFPIATYDLKFSITGKSTYLHHIFLENSQCDDITQVSSSIANLVRLGLLTVDYNRHIVDLSSYQKFEEHPIYQKMKKDFSSEAFQSQATFLSGSLNSDYIKSIEPGITKGILEITPLGKDFIKTCIC
ncbi:DUF4393 domain-containing protein [Lysinibacillus fusiformis]|uniref:DUF4393 domain-containing protein n=1 Tax=Lysinibacillus fusiformis TaxID=28031 RepID=UPI002E2159DB|nr:DUF4393 domain-containing protein [Lysinibacillus fusiformis]